MYDVDGMIDLQAWVGVFASLIWLFGTSEFVKLPRYHDLGFACRISFARCNGYSVHICTCSRN
jgi:hypothetical protein